ncbi:MAG: RimK family protein [Pirellulales bacterium]|nr:RimK family protein [Pirellulales bacterium]
MPPLIVVNNPKEWTLQMPGVDVIDARSYLARADFGELKGVKLFNLCRSYRYQSIGYYVTLLATARGHKPVPNITTIQDMKSQTVVRFVSEDLESLIQQALAPVHSEQFTLSVYFGRNVARRYNRLSLELFNLFQAPLLRAQFVRNGKWQLRQIGPIPVGDIPPQHRDFVEESAAAYFAGRRTASRKRVPVKYELAILANPEEELAPSNERALARFAKAAETLGLNPERVTQDDYARIAEFDALFIRETTAVNHHTYRFARRAAIEGLVVVDDPESILKCTNKVYLAELLSRHKVPIPRTVLLHKENLEAVGRELGFPCVLKQPDSAFSQGVLKVENADEFAAEVEGLLARSELIIAQEFLPTTFDWRIGVFDRQLLYACKYHMVPKHWQITQQDGARRRYGKCETLPLDEVPPQVLRAAQRAANLIGSGLYGVDVKQLGRRACVIEVNDNPNIDAGVEDRILGQELYERIMRVFLQRIEQRKAGKQS